MGTNITINLTEELDADEADQLRMLIMDAIESRTDQPYEFCLV
jgi:hypothetical protein